MPIAHGKSILSFQQPVAKHVDSRGCEQHTTHTTLLCGRRARRGGGARAPSQAGARGQPAIAIVPTCPRHLLSDILQREARNKEDRAGSWLEAMETLIRPAVAVSYMY